MVETMEEATLELEKINKALHSTVLQMQAHTSAIDSKFKKVTSQFKLENE